MFRCYSEWYFTQRKENPLPRITIVGEYDDGVLRLAASRCSLKDRFVKKIGRDIAEERLKTNQHLLEIKLNKFDTQTFYDYANILIDHIWEGRIKVNDKINIK